MLAHLATHLERSFVHGWPTSDKYHSRSIPALLNTNGSQWFAESTQVSLAGNGHLCFWRMRLVNVASIWIVTAVLIAAAASLGGYLLLFLPPRSLALLDCPSFRISIQSCLVACIMSKLNPPPPLSSSTKAVKLQQSESMRSQQSTSSSASMFSPPPMPAPPHHFEVAISKLLSFSFFPFQLLIT